MGDSTTKSVPGAERRRIAQEYERERSPLLTDYLEKLRSDPERYRKYIEGSWESLEPEDLDIDD